jgi:hypothetical protein
MLLDFINGESDRRINRVMLLILLLIYYNSLRDRHYLLRAAIVYPHEAPWRKLYEKADDSSFLHMTGLNRHAFKCLLWYLFDDDEIVSRRRRGRPRSLGADGYLGLLLFYLGSTMQYKHLCLIFGLTPTVCGKAINWMLRRTVRLLADHPFAKVKFPDDVKMREFANMVKAREPLAEDVIGFMDGVSFQTECTSEQVEQNAFYCGYDCDTMVNNVYAFGPDGKVFFAAVNFPGSWADGSLTARFLYQIKRRIGGFKICVDQGFPRGGDASGMFVGPVSKRQARRLHRNVRNYLLRISNVHTSLRQASEWGMRGMQGTFPRCKKRLPGDDKMRRLVLDAIVLVHNFRADYVGYSQIRTVFDPEYERVANLDGYDRIAHYYFRPGDYDSEVDGSGGESDNDNSDVE